MPVFGGGRALFQPVYVGDIARAVELLLSRDDLDIMYDTDGKVIEAGGPDGSCCNCSREGQSLTFKAVFSYREIMELVLRYTNRWRPIVSLPFAIGLMQASVLEKLPTNLLTVTQDQVISALFPDRTIAKTFVRFGS